MPSERGKKGSQSTSAMSAMAGGSGSFGTPMEVDRSAGDGPVPGQGFGLEEIGIPGRDFLRESLTNCSDPLKAIEEFQVNMT